MMAMKHDAQEDLRHKNLTVGCLSVHATRNTPVKESHATVVRRSRTSMMSGSSKFVVDSIKSSDPSILSMVYDENEVDNPNRYLDILLECRDSLCAIMQAIPDVGVDPS